MILNESYCEIWVKKMGMGSWHKKHAVLNSNKILYLYEESDHKKITFMFYIDICTINKKEKNPHEIILFNGYSNVPFRFKS